MRWLNISANIKFPIALLLQTVSLIGISSSNKINMVPSGFKYSHNSLKLLKHSDLPGLNTFRLFLTMLLWENI